MAKIIYLCLDAQNLSGFVNDLAATQKYEDVSINIEGGKEDISLLKASKIIGCINHQIYTKHKKGSFVFNRRIILNDTANVVFTELGIDTDIVEVSDFCNKYGEVIEDQFSKACRRINSAQNLEAEIAWLAYVKESSTGYLSWSTVPTKEQLEEPNCTYIEFYNHRRSVVNTSRCTFHINTSLVAESEIGKIKRIIGIKYKGCSYIQIDDDEIQLLYQPLYELKSINSFEMDENEKPDLNKPITIEAFVMGNREVEWEENDYYSIQRLSAEELEEKQNEEKPEKVIGELPIVYKDNFNDEIIKEMIRFLQRIFGLEGIGVNYNYGKNSNRDSSNDLFKLLNNKRFRNFENNSGYKTKSESIKDFEYIKSLLTEADLPIMVSSDLEIIRELIITSITFMKRINKNDKKNKAFWKNIFKKLLEWYLECYYNYYPKALSDVFYYTKSYINKDKELVTEEYRIGEFNNGEEEYGTVEDCYNNYTDEEQSDEYDSDPLAPAEDTSYME